VKISALDENGKPVDWWFVYKVPQGSAPGATGYEYVYYDPKIAKVVVSPYQLKVDKGALDVTIDSIFNSTSATTGWILYNDERPEAKPVVADNGSLGHTKGMLAFDTDTDTALWLLHSWPKYASPGAKEMPTPKYGQTYLCVSIDLATANAIAQVMINHQEPQVFNWGRGGKAKKGELPDGLGKSDPLRLLIGKIDPNAPGDSHVHDFQSRGGKKFKLIAKNRKWGGDFWNQLVGPALGVNIDVETWIRGGAITTTKDSDAPGAINLKGKLETFDIKAIDLTKLGIDAPWKWPETSDHAKWGIGEEADWVCVGDINRMVSQEKRGGGTIAFQEQALWSALRLTDSLKTGKVTAAKKTRKKPAPLPATTTTSSSVKSKAAKKPAAKKKPAAEKQRRA
jgi:deoxyribonuclease II